MEENVCKEATYKAVFKEHARALRNFLYYKSGNLSVSEDLVQDTFLKLWENCSKVTPQKAKSYLFTIANNLFLNSIKHQKVV
ncbi:MAG: RNA polymerase sigma factor, partial [Bacteroidota bacterium]